MEIFDLPHKDSMQKDEMEILQQKQHEFVFVRSERKVPGHTMFSFNTETKEIKVAPVEYSKDIDFKTQEPTYKPKLVIEPNCVYRQALNKRNFIKRLKREGIL